MEDYRVRSVPAEMLQRERERTISGGAVFAGGDESRRRGRRRKGGKTKTEAKSGRVWVRLVLRTASPTPFLFIQQNK